MYDNPSFIFHYSTHVGGIIPRDKVATISKNNLKPRKINISHTSFCLHKSIVKTFQYEGYIQNKKEYICGDIQLITHIEKNLSENLENYTIFIPLLLCTHDQQQEALR